MRDEELIELRNRFLLGLLIVLLLCVPIGFFLKNKFYICDNEIIKEVNNKSNFLVLVVKDKCKYCSISEKELNELDINYYLLNSDREKSYDTILKNLNLTSVDIIYPTLIYVEDGEVKSTLTNIKSKEEIDTYLDNYGLLKE